MNYLLSKSVRPDNSMACHPSTTLSDTDDVTKALLRSLRIDRTNPTPLWVQVAQCLQEFIESGAIPPGSQPDNEVLLSLEAWTESANDLVSG